MGQVFAGRYELLDPIADGGMGSVWVVHDRRDDDIKAAKLLRQQDASSLLRFMREQATRIHHDHVVTPLGWAGEDDNVLFTMPLLRGGSVATLLADHGTLPEQWVAEILVQTLDGLAAVHAAGIVHRDIKPANLLLESTGQARPHVRLTDFGVAVPADQPRLTAPHTSLGTPGYMSPEQTAGADPHPLQDVYAVGVTGLTLLTGHTPPHDETALPHTPLVATLRDAVAHDPAVRPPSATEFAARLRTAVDLTTWQASDVEVLDHFDGHSNSAAGPEAATGQDAATAPNPTRVTTLASAPDHPPARSLAWWPGALLLLVGLAFVVLGVTLIF